MDLKRFFAAFNGIDWTEQFSKNVRLAKLFVIYTFISLANYFTIGQPPLPIKLALSNTQTLPPFRIPYKNNSDTHLKKLNRGQREEIVWY